MPAGMGAFRLSHLLGGKEGEGYGNRGIWNLLLLGSELSVPVYMNNTGNEAPVEA